MKNARAELLAGAFVVIAVACMFYLSIKLGDMSKLTSEGYELHAIFSDVGGLRSGAPVTIAGVTIGEVASIVLEDYTARVVLLMDEDVDVPDGSVASVKTRGLIGEQYVAISPGPEEKILEPGERISQTQSAIDVYSLIGKYAFGEVE